MIQRDHLAKLKMDDNELASRLAAQFQGSVTALQTSALFGLAALLLVIGLASNLLAQWIARRFDASGLAR